MALDPITIYQGDSFVIPFQFYDLVADKTGKTPLDLTGKTLKWSIARASGGSYSSTPKVDKSSATSADVTVGALCIATADVFDGGTGYAVGDVLVVRGGRGQQASLVVVTVDGAGSIQELAIKEAGKYLEAPSSPTSVGLGSGSGCMVNITTKVAAGLALVAGGAADTEKLLGDFHQEIELFDQNGAHVVADTGPWTILRNVKNA